MRWSMEIATFAAFMMMSITKGMTQFQEEKSLFERMKKRGLNRGFTRLRQSYAAAGADGTHHRRLNRGSSFADYGGQVTRRRRTGFNQEARKTGKLQTIGSQPGAT